MKDVVSKDDRTDALAGAEENRRASLHGALSVALRRALAVGPISVRVRGQSMVPTYRDGESVRVVACRSEELQPGDIVLLDTEPLTLHRWVGRVWSDVVLAGDGNVVEDPPRCASTVLGRVVDPRPVPVALPLRRWAKRARAACARWWARRG